MDCPECEPRLIDYASHELPEDERVGVARHLAGCPRCALEYCRLQADLEGIAEAHAESPRPEVFAALRREVARGFRPAWWTRTWRVLARPVPMYGALLVALVPAALWLLVTVRPSPAEPPVHPEEHLLEHVVGIGVARHPPADERAQPHGELVP